VLHGLDGRRGFCQTQGGRHIVLCSSNGSATSIAGESNRITSISTPPPELTEQDV